jgi:hypothetical protein
MKNIFVALALFVALGATAQTEKDTTTPQSTIVATQLTPEAAAERDMQALSEIVSIDDSMKANVNKIFITKYRAKQEAELSTMRFTALTAYVESQLATYLDDASFAKLKADTELYNQLVK